VSQRISSLLEPPEWLPAAGQGAIAIQIRGDDEATRALVAPLADARTMLDTRAERAFLGALEGGCQVPIGALAAASATGRTLWGLLSDVGGRRVVRGQMPLDDSAPELTGVRLANDLRHRGGNEILDSLRRAEHLPSPQPE
jgi:hydroxymethylbilane synthase